MDQVDLRKSNDVAILTLQDQVYASHQQQEALVQANLQLCKGFHLNKKNMFVYVSIKFKQTRIMHLPTNVAV